MSRWDGGAFTRDGTLHSGTISTEDKYCEDCLWEKSDVSKGQVIVGQNYLLVLTRHLSSIRLPSMFYPQVPNTAKLLRLSFHDCAPYIREDGEVYGGGRGHIEHLRKYLYIIISTCY